MVKRRETNKMSNTFGDDVMQELGSVVVTLLSLIIGSSLVLSDTKAAMK